MERSGSLFESYTYKLIREALQDFLVSFLKRKLTNDEVIVIRTTALSITERLSEELGYVR